MEELRGLDDKESVVGEGLVASELVAAGALTSAAAFSRRFSKKDTG